MGMGRALQLLAVIGVGGAVALGGAAPAGARAPGLGMRIVGGTAVDQTTADPGPYPFMAAVVSAGAPDDYDGQFCGGSIVAPQRILTAAHCVEGVSPSQIAVVVGRRKLTSTAGQRIAVAAIATMPAYVGKTFKNDVAQIFLSAPVDPADTAIAPVAPSPSASDDPLWAEVPPAELSVIGWGSTVSPPAKSFPDDLQEVKVHRQADVQCGLAYSVFDSQTMLCASDPNKDSCQGDSGGALFAGAAPGPYKQVGIVSFGDGCAKPNFPGVYTRLGAPAINAFATDSNPLLAPYPTATPAVVPDPAPGSDSTCAGAQFGGGAADRVDFAWYKQVSGTTFRQVKSGSTFRPASDDVGARLVCSVTATNAAGYSTAQSFASPPVAAPAAAAVTPAAETPSPAPVASPPLATDNAAPRAVVTRRSCVKRRCRIAVAIADAEPSAGQFALDARLVSSGPLPACIRRHGLRLCHKPKLASHNVATHAVEPGRFSLVTRRLEPGRYRLTIAAADGAGNVQVVPTVLTLTVI
jgi:hypothetical protein